MTKSRSTCPGASSRQPRPISASRPSIRRRKSSSARWSSRKGRFGRKNGKGFYDYPEKGGKKRLWPGLAALGGTPQDPDTIDVQELKDRFLVVQAVEAARTVAEGVVEDPREADVGSIFGFGFPPFTGGALSYIDFMGLTPFVALCDKLSKAHGDRFVPPRLVLDMAKAGETFYGRFAAASKAA